MRRKISSFCNIHSIQRLAEYSLGETNANGEIEVIESDSLSPPYIGTRKWVMRCLLGSST